MCEEEHNPTYPGFGAGIVRGMQQLNRWSLLLPFPTAGHTQKKRKKKKKLERSIRAVPKRINASYTIRRIFVELFLEATATDCGSPGVIPPSAKFWWNF